MRKSRFTEEQIIAARKSARGGDADEGALAGEAGHLGVETLYRW